MNRRRVLRAGLVAVLIVAAVAFALWPGRPKQTRILGVAPSTSSGAHEVVLSVASCNADLSFHVLESDDAVAVMVWKRYSTMDDCADSLRVPLESPFGLRVVIDLSNWELVESRP